MKLRLYKSSDLQELSKLFSETVLTVNLGDYNEEQVEKWASSALKFTDEKFFLNHTVVAENEKGEIIGYGMMDSTGYFDHLFVHKDYQRKGVAQAISENLESYAKSIGAKKITVHASITAKPFFLKAGYTVISSNEVKIDEVTFVNYKMEKEM